MLNCLKFHHILRDTTALYAPTSALYSQKMISWNHGLLRDVNSLQL